MQENSNLKVINLFAGPGTGKSTLAAHLYAEMKRDGYSVELVREFVKDIVWDEHSNLYKEQDWIFANQHRQLRRLVNKVEYAISDSPLLLSAVYASDDYYSSFKTFVHQVYNSYTNINVLLVRSPNVVWKDSGRYHSHEQSIELDQRIQQLLLTHDVPYVVVDPTNQSTVNNLIRYIDKVSKQYDHNNRKN